MIKDKLKAIHPRHVFQFAVLILTLAIGLQFYLYVRQAQTAAPITIQRPPGVEGFLPIGALMGWKRFLLTGDWDTVHPAAMVIGWAVLLSFLLRKTFRGWFCPVGTVSEWCWRLGERLFGRNVHFFKWLDIPLRSLKYVLLGLFVWVIGGMTADQIAAFINSPYYRISDAKMLQFFTQMTALTAVVLLVLLTLSVFIKNFWCRYLCPYGALLGIFSAIRTTAVRAVICVKNWSIFA